MGSGTQQSRWQVCGENSFSTSKNFKVFSATLCLHLKGPRVAPPKAVVRTLRSFGENLTLRILTKQAIDSLVQVVLRKAAFDVPRIHQCSRSIHFPEALQGAPRRLSSHKVFQSRSESRHGQSMIIFGGAISIPRNNTDKIISMSLPIFQNLVMDHHRRCLIARTRCHRPNT